MSVNKQAYKLTKMKGKGIHREQHNFHLEVDS